MEVQSWQEFPSALNPYPEAQSKHSVEVQESQLGRTLSQPVQVSLAAFKLKALAHLSHRPALQIMQFGSMSRHKEHPVPGKVNPYPP